MLLQFRDLGVTSCALRGFLLLAFVDNPSIGFKQVQPSPYRADHTRVKQLETDNPFVTLVSRRG